MAYVFNLGIVLALCLLWRDGNPHSTYSRFVLDNPADMSIYLGYKDHGIHDMSSLVDEAQTKAHGQSGSGNDVAGAGSGIPYNTPNFPSQSGSNPMVASATNTQGHSLSFAGTNLWRCDAHVIDVCDLNCLDVDPKNGCPFCIQSCQTTLHGTSGQALQSGTSSAISQSGPTTGVGQSGSPFKQPASGTGSQTGLSQVGSVFQQPSTGSGSQTGLSQVGSQFQQLSGGIGTQTSNGQSGSVSQQSSGLSGTGLQPGSGQSGTISQQPSGLSGIVIGNSQQGSVGQQLSGLAGTGTQSGTGSGNSQQGFVVQQPSGLTGTGSQSGTGTVQQPSSLTGTGSQSGGGQGAMYGQTTTAKPVCPHYPPNCPAVYTKLVNGCLSCNILQPGVNVPTTTVPASTHLLTCPPKRCVAPCNLGIIIGTDGCPRCKCPDHI